MLADSASIKRDCGDIEWRQKPRFANVRLPRGSMRVWGEAIETRSSALLRTPRNGCDWPRDLVALLEEVGSSGLLSSFFFSPHLPPQFEFLLQVLAYDDARRWSI